MPLTAPEIARMMDFSAVRGTHTPAEIDDLVAAAREHECACAMVMPCYVSRVRARIESDSPVKVGTVIGFPSGANASVVKADEVRQAIADGADELDMVINVGMLLAGELDYVEHDIQSVIRAAEGRPVKVIIETHYLDAARIRTASEICLRARAAFVKTSTGWAETGAKPEDIRVIKSVVDDAAGIKASGGIRDLDTLTACHDAGARRFGISVSSALKILAAAG
jgi:deoxyribose-phosphate aldolase